MSIALGCGLMGLILAGCAAYAVSVLHDRRPGSPAQLPPGLARSPAHDEIRLSDDEECAFAEAVLAYFQREDVP